MKLVITAATLALALTACATDNGPYEGDVLPGRTLGKSLCLTGCSSEVDGFIEQNNFFDVGDGIFQKVEETENTGATPNFGDHANFGIGVQTVKATPGNAHTGELSTSVVDGGPVPSNHGNFNVGKDQCAGAPFTGACQNTCASHSAVSQQTGSSICAVVSCADRVVIARCSL